MSDASDHPSYDVGYKRPPRHSQFRKGQSGNPRGRPPSRGPVKLDFDQIVNAPIPITQNGRSLRMQPKEIALRKILHKAVTKADLRSIVYLLDQFAKYGVVDWQATETRRSVINLPNTMPWRMAMAMLKAFGEPPWLPRQVERSRDIYLASRSEAERDMDEAMAYPDLRMRQ